MTIPRWLASSPDLTQFFIACSTASDESRGKSGDEAIKVATCGH